MTPFPLTPPATANAEIQRLVDTLNARTAEFRAEGLVFQYSADPAFPGVGLQVPGGRVTLP